MRGFIGTKPAAVVFSSDCTQQQKAKTVHAYAYSFRIGGSRCISNLCSRSGFIQYIKPQSMEAYLCSGLRPRWSLHEGPTYIEHGLGHTEWAEAMTVPLTLVCGPPSLLPGFGRRLLLYPSHSQQARVLLGFPWLLLLSFLGYLVVCLHDPIALDRFKMSMSFPNIRDLLASFSPSLDFFAISSGDGRIKVVRSLNVWPI